MRKRVTKEKINKIREFMNDGRSVSQIQKELDISTAALYKHIKKLGFEVGNLIPDAVKEEIKKAYENGMSFIEIAESYNVSYVTARRYALYKQPRYTKTCDIPCDVVNEIRLRVNDGVSKRQVSDDMNIPYNLVYNCTKDIKKTKPLTTEIRQQIDGEYEKGTSLLDIASLLDVKICTVRRYVHKRFPGTRIIRYCGISEELKEKICNEVFSGKEVGVISKKYHISCNMINRFTKDTHSSRCRFVNGTYQKDMGDGILVRRNREYLIILPETIEEIRQEVKNGKSKKQVSKEYNISYNSIRRVTKDIQFSKCRFVNGTYQPDMGDGIFIRKNQGYIRIPPETIEEIRQEVKNGKSKKQVSEEYNISYHSIKTLTKDIQSSRRRLGNETYQKDMGDGILVRRNQEYLIILPETIEEIRQEVKNGKSKKQVSEEYNISYNFIRKVTRDIQSFGSIFVNGTYQPDIGDGILVRKNQGYIRIPPETIEEIRQEVKNGKSKKQVSKEYNISYHSISKITRDIQSNYSTPRLTKEIIEKIREQALTGKSKIQIAKDFNISYHNIIYHTSDIKNDSSRKSLDRDTINRIRDMVSNGKRKMQVSRELGIPPRVVYYYTLDILSAYPRNQGIDGKTLEFLEQLMRDGYVMSFDRHQSTFYKKLRSRFPNIRKVRIFGAVIYFLQENSDIAMRVFLEKINKRKMSYRQLQQIITVFSGKMEKNERKKYVQ
jgi:transposase